MGYIHEDNAARQVNRSKWTLRDWRLKGLVHGVKRGEFWFYDEAGLIGALYLNERRYRERWIAPGTGGLSGRVRRYRSVLGEDEGLW